MGAASNFDSHDVSLLLQIFSPAHLSHSWELQSLVDYGPLLHPPALPAGHPFINISLSPDYWSSTTYNVSTNLAWYVHFNDGDVNFNYMVSPYYVWCVRGGP